MAYLYETVISTGTNKINAQAMCDFFDGRKYTTPLGSFLVRAFIWASPADSSFVVVIYTIDHGESGIGSIEEAVICSFMHYGIYNDLRIINLYYEKANSGIEINDLITDEFILSRPNKFTDKDCLLYNGCIISREMYHKLNEPAVFEKFGKNHYWRPFQGIDFNIFKSITDTNPTLWRFLDHYQFE